MSKWVIDITIELEADNADDAWSKANVLASDLNVDVTQVSEPEEID